MVCITISRYLLISNTAVVFLIDNIMEVFHYLFTVYFDLTDDCHDLSFSFGQNAIGAAKESSRRFSVKVSMFYRIVLLLFISKSYHNKNVPTKTSFYFQRCHKSPVIQIIRPLQDVCNGSLELLVLAPSKHLIMTIIFI